MSFPPRRKSKSIKKSVRKLSPEVLQKRRSRQAFKFLLSLGDEQYERFMLDVNMNRAQRKVYGEAIVAAFNQGSTLFDRFIGHNSIPVSSRSMMVPADDRQN
jgi:hypothetical protein